MTLPKIGAALNFSEIAALRDWLFDAGRDIELQDFMSAKVLNGDWKDLADAAKRALDGHQGRLGIHGPYRGLDIDNSDPEIQKIITARFLRALEVCERIGAAQMVLHSPYSHWYKNNLYTYPGYREGKLKKIHAILDPVVKRAEETGVTLVIENIQDVDPDERKMMAQSFDSDAVALSIDTGHAHLARFMSGAPPVDFFFTQAGEMLQHVHVQDLDGHADRHWAPGDGTIEWSAVFKALRSLEHSPHLVLELRHKEDIPRAFTYLHDLGLCA